MQTYDKGRTLISIMRQFHPKSGPNVEGERDRDGRGLMCTNSRADSHLWNFHLVEKIPDLQRLDVV